MVDELLVFSIFVVQKQVLEKSRCAPIESPLVLVVGVGEKCAVEY
jgi:hypothetical protein